MRTTEWRAVDAGRAAWAARRLLLTASDEPAQVASLVPGGFAAYTRLRHAGSPGGLPVEQLAALCDALAPHTQTPDRCTFDLGDDWPGWRPPGPGSPGGDETRGAGPVPGMLVAASLEDAVPLAYSDEPGRWWARSPAAFWPDDRSWYVAASPHLTGTLVGGSVALGEELLAVAGLDTWPVRPTDPAEG